MYALGSDLSKKQQEQDIVTKIVDDVVVTTVKMGINDYRIIGVKDKA